MAEQPTDRVRAGRPAGQADIDPDLDSADAGVAAASTAPGSPSGTDRRFRPPVPWRMLGVISAGGVAGALIRYGVGDAFPHRPDEFPWATFGINVSGCLLIGVLMVLVTDVWPTRWLLRPFLGTGLLGGYTTFSTYIVDIQHLLAAAAARIALTYLAGTLLAALVAVYAGSTGTRVVLGRLRLRDGTATSDPVDVIRYAGRAPEDPR